MKKGFTLIELLVVIAIIGILSAIGLVSLNGAREKARDAQAKSDLGQMRTALTLFADDNSSAYPDTVGGGQDFSSNTDGDASTGVWLDGGDIVGPYLGSELISPSVSTYIYKANAVNTGNNDSTDYVLYYPLESGTGGNFYAIFEDGMVYDYSDTVDTAPHCDALPDTDGCCLDADENNDCSDG